VQRLTTPTVLAVVRKYLDCNSLVGAELENQPTTAGSCFGSHFEARIFADDVMSAVSVDDGTGALQHKTPLLLAALQDSGWYRANFNVAGLTVPEWGRAAGCAFATEKCVSDAGVAIHPFCATASSEGCSADYTHKALCSIQNYNSDLPKKFQYFSTAAAGSSSRGGSQREMDFCPHYTPYSNGDCQRIDSARADSDAPNSMGEAYGASSHCLAATTLRQTVQRQYLVDETSTPGCYQTSCGAMETTTTSTKTSAGGGRRVRIRRAHYRHEVRRRQRIYRSYLHASGGNVQPRGPAEREICDSTGLRKGGIAVPLCGIWQVYMRQDQHDSNDRFRIRHATGRRLAER